MLLDEEALQAKKNGIRLGEQLMRVYALPEAELFRALARQFSIEFVPEPGTVALLTVGLAGLLAYAWRKRK